MKHTITPLVLFLLFFVASNIVAQNDKNFSKISTEVIDSLRNELKNAGEYEAAIPYALEMVKRTKKTKPDSISALAIKNLGVLYYYNGDYQEALPLFKESRETYLKLYGALHKEYLARLNNLATLLSDLGKYEEAEPLFAENQHALEQTLGIEHEDYAWLLYNFARMYYYMEHYKAAESLFLQAKKVWAKTIGTQATDYAECLNGLASLYKDIEHFEAAEPLYLEALEIQLAASKGIKNAAYATCLVNLASLYKQMEEYAKAETLYLEAIEIDKKEYGELHPNYFPDLNDLADLYISTRRYNLAEPLYQQAKTIIQKTYGVQHPDYALVLDNIAFLYMEMKRYDDAEKMLLESEKIYQKTLGTRSPDYIQTLNELATLYYLKGNYENIKKYSVDALLLNCTGLDTTNILTSDWIKDLPNHYYVSEHQAFASIEELYGYYKYQYKISNNKTNLEIAYELTQAAMNISTKLRHHIAGEGDQLRLLSFNTRFVQKGIATALELDEVNKSQVHQNKSFGFAEQNKSILLAEALKAQRAKTFGNIPDSLALKDHTYSLQYSELKKKLLQPHDDTEHHRLRNELTELNLEREKFKKDLEIKYPKFYKDKYDIKNIDIPQVQSLLDENTAMLEYFIADTNVYLFFISKERSELITLPVRRVVLDKNIKILRNALSNYAFIGQNKTKAYSDYTKTAYWFWEKLLAPALSKTPNSLGEKGRAIQGGTIENLIIITDGELGHLPFEAFLTKPAPQELTNYNKLDYVIKMYQVGYNYSATLWRSSLEQQVRNNNHQIFACAPTYEKGAAQKMQSRAGRAMHLRELRAQLNTLPAAEKEVEKLASLFSGKFFYGAEANETNFKAMAADFGVVHLAMHGLLSQQYPILSSLVFSENGDKSEDNFLEAYEISELTLNNDLVVLSACETGYGKFAQGEGVLSLARSFMYAGVPSVVVSLWQVNDQSTSIIMQNFYQNLSDGMTKTQALQQAKLTYIAANDDFVAHPAFWAPFVQIGSNQAIELKPKSRGMYWALGGVGALVVLLGGVVLARRK